MFLTDGIRTEFKSGSKMRQTKEKNLKCNRQLRRAFVNLWRRWVFVFKLLSILLWIINNTLIRVLALHVHLGHVLIFWTKPIYNLPGISLNIPFAAKERRPNSNSHHYILFRSANLSLIFHWTNDNIGKIRELANISGSIE